MEFWILHWSYNNPAKLNAEKQDKRNTRDIDIFTFEKEKGEALSGLFPI